MLNTENVFIKKRRNTFLLVFGFVALYAIFAGIIGIGVVDLGLGFAQSPLGFVWLFENFMPTADSVAVIPMILRTLWGTILLAVAASFIASIFALVLAVMGSRALEIHPMITYTVRMIAMFFRNIPLAAWAMILLFSFSQNEFTGFMAMFFGTLGYSIRSFVEIIDEASEGAIEALKAAGASYFQIVFQAILPMIAAQAISWLLFMIESNIREATLVGVLTGTGIGFLFNFYFRGFRYSEAGMVILFIVVTVLLLEVLSNKIRRVVL